MKTDHLTGKMGTSGGSRIFPGGVSTPKIAIIFQIFAENCMKMKEFGPRGSPPGSANGYRTHSVRQMVRLYWHSDKTLTETVTGEIGSCLFTYLSHLL